MDFDEVVDRIEAARGDADYWASQGSAEKASVALSREDCAAISELLTKAFACAAVLGRRDSETADKLAILGGAFAGEEDE